MDDYFKEVATLISAVPKVPVKAKRDRFREIIKDSGLPLRIQNVIFTAYSNTVL